MKVCHTKRSFEEREKKRQKDERMEEGKELAHPEYPHDEQDVNDDTLLRWIELFDEEEDRHHRPS